MAETRIFLTTVGAGTWTVPDDCLSATIECIGGGGGGVGNANRVYGGGGGGAYAKKNNLSLTPGSSISYSVGIGGGVKEVGGDSWFSSTATVLAKGGNWKQSNSSPATGGQSSDCVGDVKYSGGDAVQGGGGAAGLNGIGGNASGFTGGTGDAGFGGAGGDTYDVGGAGTEFDATHGSGGGGGGVSGSGGLYGGGGGRNVSGGGAQGLIVITYTPVVSGSSKFFQLF